MSFVADGFETIGNASGTISMDFDGEAIEMPYEATLYLNGDVLADSEALVGPSGPCSRCSLPRPRCGGCSSTRSPPSTTGSGR